MAAELTVRDVMTREFLGVSESDSVDEVARLMVQEDETTAAVMRGDEPVGTVMGTSMLGALLEAEGPEETPIEEVMYGPPRMIEPGLTLSDAAGILADADVDYVAVGGPDGVAGLLTESDLLTAVSSVMITADEAPLDDDYDAGVTERTESMSSQSVCEVCGTLKTNLENVNGQVVCDDCRTV